MRPAAITAAILFFLAACSSRNALPEGVIAIKPMQSLVWDMIQADETAMQHKFADSALDLKKESFRLYDQVFAIHKVSRKQFYTSYRYYQEHPPLYKALMAGVRSVGEKQRKASGQPGR